MTLLLCDHWMRERASAGYRSGSGFASAMWAYQPPFPPIEQGGRISVSDK